MAFADVFLLLALLFVGFAGLVVSCGGRHGPPGAAARRRSAASLNANKGQDLAGPAFAVASTED